MKNVLKTIVYAPLVFAIGTIFYTVLLAVILLSYFIATLMLPTKLHSYLNQLDEYRRIKT